MSALMLRLLLTIGLPAGRAQRLVRPIAIVVVAIAVAGAIWAAFALVHRAGRNAGSSEVRGDVAQQRAGRIAEARTDERTALDVTRAIAASTARADAITDDQLRITIEDLRHAIDDVPPAVAGASPPAAPFERLYDDLNAGIDRANRAADPAAAAH